MRATPSRHPHGFPKTHKPDLSCNYRTIHDNDDAVDETLQDVLHANLRQSESVVDYHPTQEVKKRDLSQSCLCRGWHCSQRQTDSGAPVSSKSTSPNRTRCVGSFVAVAVVANADAQVFSASDSVFAPASWSVSVLGASVTKAGSASQVVNGFATGSNALLSSINPGGADAWTVSIYENFYYDPSLTPGTPSSVTLTFDSRWVTQNFSRVGPAMRQGGAVWAGYQPLNSNSWATYSFSGWVAMVSGTGLPLPDFSATAAPIYFGFYQRNGGTVPGVGYQSEFANFSVSVTAPVVPAPMALLLWVAPAAARTRRRAS